MDAPTITVMINPRGGQARQPGVISGLQELLRSRLPQAEIVMLTGAEQATAQARAAAAAGRDVVVAAGGDGTIIRSCRDLVGLPQAWACSQSEPLIISRVTSAFRLTWRQQSRCLPPGTPSPHRHG